MHKMSEKLTVGSYSASGVLVFMGKFFDWLHDVDWNTVAIIVGILIGVATYCTNVYFQRRQEKISQADSDRRIAIMQQIAEKINPNNPPSAVKVMAEIAAQTSEIPSPPTTA